METITSFSNSQVKRLIKLKDRKYRTEYAEYLAEGKRWVLDAIVRVRDVDDITCIAVSESVYSVFLEEVLKLTEKVVSNREKVLKLTEKALSNAEEVLKLTEENLAITEKVLQKIIVIEDSVFNKISDTENSQGVVASLKIKQTDSLPSSKNCLLLDRIRDPGNMGSIIRTACAAGFTDIVCNSCVDVYNPKTVRSCMTGLLMCNIHCDIAPECIKNSGYNLLAAALGGEDLFSVKLPDGKICLIIGNEANGIDEEIISLCEKKVEIPMENIESLNAGVSAAILMYFIKYFKS